MLHTTIHLKSYVVSRETINDINLYMYMNDFYKIAERFT